MAEATVKATYSLDPETIETLARLAEAWKVSKSEALRRSIRLAARSAPAPKSRLQAFRELQASLRLSSAEADRWIAEVREERAAWKPVRRARPK